MSWPQLGDPLDYEMVNQTFSSESNEYFVRRKGVLKDKTISYGKLIGDRKAWKITMGWTMIHETLFRWFRCKRVRRLISLSVGGVAADCVP